MFILEVIILEHCHHQLKKTNCLAFYIGMIRRDHSVQWTVAILV